MKVILNSSQIEGIIQDLAKRIAAEIKNKLPCPIAVIGIRSRGEILGQRLSKELSGSLGIEIPCGTLDITLYRDDLNSPHGNVQPEVRTTEIGFNIDDRIIILVDDVLHTGRSVRAAMGALIDLGRPKAIKLAVLVEREGREYPIQADFVGFKAQVELNELVCVHMAECDGKDEVFIESS